MFKVLFIGYLFGVRSERQLVPLRFRRAPARTGDAPARTSAFSARVVRTSTFGS
jgi:hypothetical protein